MTTMIESIPFSRRAKSGLDQLTDEDQRAISESLAELAGMPWSRWPADRLWKLASPEPLYMFAATPDWRLFLRAPEGDGPPLVEDFARKTLLDMFAAK